MILISVSLVGSQGMGALTPGINVMCSCVQGEDNDLESGDPLTTPATSADKLISSFPWSDYVKVLNK